MSLEGSDRLANLVQWCAMVGSVAASSLVASQLGGGRGAQLLAAVTVATLPMGILQATSTQNDYVAGFWIICFVHCGLAWQQGGDGRRRELAWGALALGLAVLTKGTTYILAAPFVFCFLVALRPWTIGGGAAASLISLAVLFMNAGHYLRTARLFGHPLSTDGLSLTNAEFSLGTLFSNLLRNLALHAATPLASLNRAVEGGVIWLHAVAGIDPQSPATTWQGSVFRLMEVGVVHEDYAGNGLHLLLALVAVPLIWRRKVGQTRTYCLAVLAGAMLFCLLLRWQPFNSRLQLPLFILWAPLTGIAFGEVRQRWAVSVGMLLSVAALPWLLFNASRPLLPLPRTLVARIAPSVQAPPSIFTAPRQEQYFRNSPWVMESFVACASRIKAAGYTRVGLRLGIDSWEYPLWALLGPGVRIEHVGVANRSAVCRRDGFVPEVVVAADDRRRLRLEIGAAGNGER
jgi:hypothetical protein